MARKTVLNIAFGILAAGLVCLIIGLSVFFALPENVISRIVSLFAMIMGGIMAAVGLVLAVALLVAQAISKARNKDKKE